MVTDAESEDRNPEYLGAAGVWGGGDRAVGWIVIASLAGVVGVLASVWAGR
jgi:hypothetical protein